MNNNKVIYEIKIEKSVKIILCLFAVGVILNAIAPNFSITSALAGEYLTHSGNLSLSVTCYGCK